MFYTNGVSEWDLFFAPKIEVVHVYQHNVMGNKIGIIKGGGINFTTGTCYKLVGTITGPIVPPEDGK
jgi:hypothetical protein